MTENTRAIEAIEQAERATPFCVCGEATTPVARDGDIWLECLTVNEPKGNAFARLLETLVAPSHIRQLVFENDKAA